MGIPEILFILALLLALIDEFRAQGQSLTGWAVVAIGIGLLWGHIG